VKAHDAVAVVECDPATRRPVGGGRVRYATVAEVGASLVKISYDERGTDIFWHPPVGWRLADGVNIRWRLVPLCDYCKAPITGEPATGQDDPLGRVWCDENCLADAGEAWADRQYARFHEG
jgi:hypothetical protein